MTIKTTATFTNPAPITIGHYNPYSDIMVSNLIGNVIKVTATVKGFTHADPQSTFIELRREPDFSIYTLLMYEAGGNVSVTNLTFTFDDSASVSMPRLAALTSGTFLPSSYLTNNFLSIFNGKDPNGSWRLYADSQYYLFGQVSNGWSLSITTEIPAPVIINPRLIGDVFAFDWLSVIGARYQVVRKSDLNSPNWTTVTNFIADDIFVGYSINTKNNPSPQFFRVEASSP